jgi:Stealth protein CR2, conserved region 2/Stealth protein CR1, conserved region 1
MWNIAQQPVDIVYLWVDGNDPVWRKKRQGAMGKLSARCHEAMAPHGNVEGRFRDNDELMFSLRALERYFPDHGHIYVVTDGQSPSWLKPSASLTIIDHRELIPESFLPTFDSGNIESYIHRIPNLSERYFYLNDDVFFGAPVDLNDWFWSGGIYVGWSNELAVSDEPLRKDSNSLENACRLSQQWFTANNIAGYEHTFQTFAHSPRPMLRSLLKRVENSAPDMFNRVRSTTFRAWDKPTVISDFVMRWALANGFAKVRDYSHVHISAGDSHTSQRLNSIAANLGSLDFFCINDTTDNAGSNDVRLVNIKANLQQLFGRGSKFERPNKVANIRRRSHSQKLDIASLASKAMRPSIITENRAPPVGSISS